MYFLSIMQMQEVEFFVLFVDYVDADMIVKLTKSKLSNTIENRTGDIN